MVAVRGSSASAGSQCSTLSSRDGVDWIFKAVLITTTVAERVIGVSSHLSWPGSPTIAPSHQRTQHVRSPCLQAHHEVAQGGARLRSNGIVLSHTSHQHGARCLHAASG